MGTCCPEYPVHLQLHWRQLPIVVICNETIIVAKTKHGHLKHRRQMGNARCKPTSIVAPRRSAHMQADKFFLRLFTVTGKKKKKLN